MKVVSIPLHSPRLESLWAPEHDDLYFFGWFYARVCTHCTKTRNTQNNKRSRSFSCRSFRIALGWFCIPWWPTHQSYRWGRNWLEDLSDHQFQGLCWVLDSLGIWLCLGHGLFCATVSSNLGRNCANMVAVLDRWICWNKLNKKLLHGDYGARFWYPCCIPVQKRWSVEVCSFS